MEEQKPAIRAGSIITLQNMAPGSGYLDTRGLVIEKPVITKFQDPQIIAFVSTHKRANRSPGSGSWQVRSAQGDSDGTPLKIGDRIYLLNMQPGAGYLDSFEWVSNLKPFAGYPMQIGVFTAHVPNRGGGVSGTWTIESAAGKQNGEPLLQDDLIYLRNDYPNAGVLQTYGTVTNHPLFAEYDDQEFFVFTGPISDPAPGDPMRGSARWTVSLSRYAIPYQVQLQWGDASSPWHSGGIFKIGDPLGPTIATLTLASADLGQSLSGQLSYRGDAVPVSVTAQHRQANVYSVFLAGTGAPPGEQREQEWLLGARDFQNITFLDIAWNESGNRFDGTIAYEGEGRIKLTGERTDPTIDDIAELLKGRTRRIDGVIDATYTLLSNTFSTISGFSLNQAITGGRQLLSQKLAQGLDPSGAIDSTFQLNQLLNLYALSQRLNAFLQNDLRRLIERSSQQHRKNKTLAPLYLFRESFRHIGADHEIIQQATIQRRWNQYQDGSYYMSEQALELLIIDKLAIKAIAPFQHLLPGSTDRMSVITYLSEKTHIHRLPYTDRVILIGVSYDRVPSAASLTNTPGLAGTQYSTAFELMAIPHEIGHYIYNYGHFEDGTACHEVSKRFAENNPYYQWCEEIFADLYGCIVAGPLSVLGMQALLASINKDRAWKDDEEHPTPVLRVFILAEILRVLHELESRIAPHRDEQKRAQVEELARKLDQDWLSIVEGWGYQPIDQQLEGRPARIYAHDQSNPQHDTIVNIERVITAIQPIIIEFATRLLAARRTGAAQADDSDALAFAIPWNTRYTTNLGIYNDDIAALTSRNFARKKVAAYVFYDALDPSPAIDDSDADACLQRYLDDWGDHGPMGSSGGTHG